MNGGHNGDLPSVNSAHRPGQDDSFINGFTNMSMYDRQLMPARSNGRLGGLNSENQVSASGPIGSQRPVNGANGAFEDQPRNGSSVAPERQPRVPPSAGEWRGFPRPRQNGHGGRGSDEIDQVDDAWRRT